MDVPYFSIIIPTLNEERFLPKLLKDLQKQKEKSFEVLVIDGHSSDKTSELAQSFTRFLPSIQVQTVEKQNVSFQRNWGARHAQGRYLIYLDADSRVNVHFIKNCLKTVRSNKSLIFIPLFHTSKKQYQDSIIFNLANFFIEVSQSFGRPISAGGSMIFEKDYFYFLGGFNEKLFFSEDYEIVTRARKYGVCAYVLKNVKITFSMRRFKKEGHFNVFKKYALAWLHHFSNKSGGIYKKIFEYKMGGSNYHILEKKLKKKKISRFFDELKHQLRLFINEFNE